MDLGQAVEELKVGQLFYIPTTVGADDTLGCGGT